MGRFPVAPAVTLVTLIALLPSAAAGSLHLAPDPLPRDTPLTVRASFSEAVSEATLRACHADGEEVVDYCLTAQPMTRGADGTWTATTPRGFPTGGLAGANVTATTTNGTTIHLPGDGSDYVFVPLSAAEASTPGPGAPLVGVVLLAVALVRGRWLP